MKKQVVTLIQFDKDRNYKVFNWIANNKKEAIYNPNLSWDNGSRITQGQWLVILQENGIEVSIATFKRYLKDRGFSKRRKQESIITKPNITTQLSIRFSDDTFPEEVVDDTSLSSDRMFREIVSSIHATDEFRRKWKV